MPTSPILAPARIEYRAHGPASLDYDDIYYASDGRNEAERVFVRPLGLETLFRASRQASIRIGELGFGTGLNFLAVCEKFLETAAPEARLVYIAFEKHPLARQDFERIARSHKPSFSVTEELIAALPRLLSGWHKRYLRDGRISLSLCYGDALQGVSEISTRCHAWLLDGFDPKRNPDMWSLPLLKRVAERSESSATLATFSAQGEMRRRLESLGCEVTRIDQRPHKRHSLLARLPLRIDKPLQAPSEVGVVGAGFAGLFTAQLLAKGGVRVHVFDPNPASMPIALAHARLGDPSLSRMQLRAVALDYSNDWYCRLGCKAGVLEVATDSRHARQLWRRADVWGATDPSLRFLTSTECRDLTGLTRIQEGLWHPNCHRVLGESLEQQLNSELISHHQTEVLSCLNRDGNWHLQLPRGVSKAFSHLVVCAGAASVRLLPQISAHCVDGQMELANADFSLPVGLVGHGFIAPIVGPQLVFGSTYEHEPLSEDLARTENIHRTGTWLEALGARRPSPVQSSWRGTRLYHQDRMPIVGEVEPGLFANSAHGSAGSTLAPLCAEVITSAILADPPALSLDLVDLMRPTR